MRNLFNIQDNVIVATGATGALAGAAARHLAACGALVFFISRTQSKIDAAVREISDNGDSADGFACDVTDREGLKRACDRVVRKYGKIDALINGAGGNRPGATIMPGDSVFDLSLEDYDQVMALNLKGTLLPSLIFGEAMAQRKSGSIVNFSSMAASRPLTRIIGYSNAKAAVDNLTRWMAADFAKKFGDGIRVNAVAPGFFLADQNRRLLTEENGSPTERGQQVIDQTPMGRFGEPQEICGAIHFLLSPAARFVTGVVLPVDGGFSAFSI
jgi:NAD(P)-dependent dehydrogenase (short-subunit alcohol dehydrogenase family)